MEYSESNTIGWQKARTYIESFNATSEVIENGNLEGYLIDFKFHYNGLQTSVKAHPLTVPPYIFKYFIPIAHIHSFGKYTTVILLFNPNSPSEVIIDPNQTPWHYEV